MRRVLDLHDERVDIVFRDNSCLQEFAWSSEEATLAETFQQAVQGLSHLTALWRPEYWTAELSPFVFEHPDTTTESYQIPADLASGTFDNVAQRIQQLLAQHSDAPHPWSLKSMQSSLAGWNRLVLPSGVRATDSWGIVDPDGILRTSYVWRSAPPFAGHDTLWIQVPDANAATHVSLVVSMTGEIQIRTNIGISFFDPQNDERSPKHMVQGATVESWQQAHLALLQAVTEAFEQQGWNVLA